MTALIAAMLLSGGIRTEDPDELGVWVRLRGGAWTSGGFAFDAIQIDGHRRVEGKVLALGGVDVGLDLTEDWFLFAGAETAQAEDVTLNSASFGLGWGMDVPEFLRAIPPFRFRVFAGVLVGTFEVDEPRFSDFEDGVGVRIAAEAEWSLGSGFRVALFAEGRAIRFDYEGDVLDGDEYAGGGGFAGGLAIGIGF